MEKACVVGLSFVLLWLCASAQTELRFVCTVMEEETTAVVYTCRLPSSTGDTAFVLGRQLRFTGVNIYNWNARLALTVANDYVRTITFFGQVTCPRIAVPSGVHVTNCVSDYQQRHTF